MIDYFSIKVPKTLANRITRIVLPKGEFRTVTEFVLESARIRLYEEEKKGNN